MATIIGIGEPANDGERMVIAHLRDHGPDSWTVVHNMELPSGRRRFEIDLVVVTPHAVYVIDVKGTRGQITVAQNRWYPHGRTPFTSPLPKLRQHARILKSLLSDANPRLRGLYVSQLLVLCDPQAQLRDPDHRDDHEVCRVNDLIGWLSDPTRVPSGFDTRVGLGRDRSVVPALTGHARPPAGARIFGNWEVVERLTESDDGVVEYRARNRSLPGGPPQVTLRVHPLDPYLPETDRVQQRLQLGNAYSTLGRLPGHPHVVGHRDFFVTDDEARGVLVLDDTYGTSLRLRLGDDEPITRDEALRILRGTASGLTHAHRHRIMHRALSPDSVLIAPDGRAILIGFDHARGAGPRAATVVNTLPDVVDPDYLAPEGHIDIGSLTPASDVYALGVLGFRLLTGELPFADRNDQHRRRSTLPVEPLDAAGVPAELRAWLQLMCAPDPAQRPTIVEGLRGLDVATRTPPRPQPRPEPALAGDDVDDRDRLRDLEPGIEITPSLTIREKLGSGSFGVVYRVHNAFARTDQAMKIILADPGDQIGRLRQEYAPLLDMPPHPNVVRVHHGDLVPGSTVPYLIFEYVPGRDVQQLITESLLTPADVRGLGIDAAAGLAHIHSHGVYHCDVKPGNLLWTEAGAKIIDFNVAVSDEYLLADAGSARYLPPDYARHDPDLVDRDLYALGLSLYEALTRGNWPWDDRRAAPAGTAPRDPRTYTDLAALAPEFVSALLTAIAPTRAERFTDATAFRTALERARDARRRPAPTPARPEPSPTAAGVDNPFVAHLQTLYSQSATSNRGTRGLDPREHDVYVATRLDEHLIPDVLGGDHRVVVITGNAGDGKTAFLEKLVLHAADLGAALSAPRPNGADFTLDGRTFRTNLDGSQDEGDRANDDVLAEFFGPYEGSDSNTWPADETHLIAINEGRLVDFLRAHATRFAALAAAVHAGLDGAGGTHDGVTLVNLNARSVIAGDEESIFDGLVRELTNHRFWAACNGCALAEKCYALHNARTLGHPDASDRVTARLRTLYTVAHLRGRLHITMRDLRSALAYTLTSGRSCSDIRDLYDGGNPSEILSGFYFQSWLGPNGTEDRLLRLLQESDISDRADPALDRVLDFGGPSAGSALATVDGRGDYDQRLLERLFELLPRGGDTDPDRTQHHRAYITAARRRFFFESADSDRWRGLLSHRSAAEFLRKLTADGPSPNVAREIIRAINRSEGLADPDKLGDAMALAVRQVRGGSIRSYRLFPLAGFSAEPDGPRGSPYIEGAPDRLRLSYTDPDASELAPAEIAIQLDLYELLWRLRRGGRPAAADMQGRHLSLSVFKNMLTSAPYQAVLLTVTGHDLHSIDRSPDGFLTLGRRGMPDRAPEEA